MARIRNLPPLFPSTDAAEAAAESSELRRNATLNRREWDRQTGTAEPRDDAREGYSSNLRDAGLDADADQLEQHWLNELAD